MCRKHACCQCMSPAAVEFNFTIQGVTITKCANSTNRMRTQVSMHTMYFRNHQIALEFKFYTLKLHAQYCSTSSEGGGILTSCMLIGQTEFKLTNEEHTFEQACV